jgi:hypothetical protein
LLIVVVLYVGNGVIHVVQITQEVFNDESSKPKTPEMIKAEKEIQAKVAAAQAKADAEWKASKAGQICQKHPTWDKDSCDGLAKGKMWIGMTYEMLAYIRGQADRKNVSNYGRGDRYQWCWDNYTPSCVYDNNNDGSIDSYN